MGSCLRCIVRARVLFYRRSGARRDLHSFPTRRSSDLLCRTEGIIPALEPSHAIAAVAKRAKEMERDAIILRSEEHTSELQSRRDLVCRLLLEKKKTSQSPQSVVANSSCQSHVGILLLI